MNNSRKWILAAPFFLSSQAFAGAPNFHDARALAMGGVGVAAARPAAAGFFNPALLAVKQPEKRDGFGMLLPSISAVASDKDELRDVIDDFEDDYVTPFESAIKDVESNIGDVAGLAVAQAELADRTEALNNELEKIDQDQVRIDLGLGMSAMVPSETFGAGLFVSGSARIAAQINYNDGATLTSLENLANDPTPIDDFDDVRALYDLYDDADQLQSTVRAVGSAYSQVGLAMSHKLRISGRDYALGLSPKMVDLRAYDYVGRADDFESDDLEDTKVSESKFNFDLGMATYLDAKQNLLLGVSIINVLPMEITTEPNIDRLNLDPTTPVPTGIDIELKPKVIAGLAYQGGAYELAADLELSKTEEVFGEGDTQYIGFGAEYDLADVFQVRGGARYNIAESEGVLLSAGFGLSVVGVTFELAALTSTDSNTVGVGTQLGLTF